MVDFRYHLVSLMAVLIALTLGVVLGAGPLQGKISNSISGEVQRLSNQQAALQQEKEKLILTIKSDKQYLTAFAGRSTQGQLQGKKVAFLNLGVVAEDIVKKQVQAVEHAGGKVVSQAILYSGWTATATQNYRHSLVAAVKEKLGVSPTNINDTDEAIMAMGLAEGITDISENAATIRDLLVKPFKAESREYKFLQFIQGPQEKADAIIVLSAPQPATKKTKENNNDNNPHFSEVGIKALTVAFTTKQGRGVVFVGSAETNNDLITRIRTSRLQVATVDDISTPICAAITTLALKDSFNGKIGAYGIQNGATSLIPPLDISE